MKEIINKITKHMIIESIISILAGIILVVWPNISTTAIVYLLAIYFAVMGIINIVAYVRTKDSVADIIAGAFELIVALIMFIFPNSLKIMIAVVLGAMIMLMGIINAVRSVEMKNLGVGSWLFVLIINILLVIAGLVVILNPFGATLWFVKMLGIILIVKGIVDIISCTCFSKSIKKQLP